MCSIENSSEIIKNAQDSDEDELGLSHPMLPLPIAAIKQEHSNADSNKSPTENNSCNMNNPEDCEEDDSRSSLSASPSTVKQELSSSEEMDYDDENVTDSSYTKRLKNYETDELTPSSLCEVVISDGHSDDRFKAAVGCSTSGAHSKWNNFQNSSEASDAKDEELKETTSDPHEDSPSGEDGDEKEQFSNVAYLKDYICTDESWRNFCTHCNRFFESETFLKEHKRMAHCGNEEVNTCLLCKETFNHPGLLNTHVALVHGKRQLPQPQKCPHCDLKFAHAGNLRRHIGRVHERKRQYICMYCGKSFGQSGNLKTHITTVHEKLKPHACPYCDAAFGESGHLKRHILGVHEKERPYTCKFCDKSFCQVANLKGHILNVHEEVSPYDNQLLEQILKPQSATDKKPKPSVCPHCNESFSNASNRRRHILRVHQNQKKFTCDQCDKSFTQMGNLKVHVTTVHEKLKPYTCEHCNKSFGGSGHLKRHIVLVHDKSKPFNCAFCDKTFGQLCNLKTHTVVVHEKQIFLPGSDKEIFLPTNQKQSSLPKTEKQSSVSENEEQVS